MLQTSCMCKMRTQTLHRCLLICFSPEHDHVLRSRSPVDIGSVLGHKVETRGTSATRVTSEPTSVVETVDGVQLGACWSSCCIQQQLTGNPHAERLLQTQLCTHRHTTALREARTRVHLFVVWVRGEQWRLNSR